MSDTKHWSKSIEADGQRKSIEVKEIENGYLVTVTREGKDAEGEWQFDTKQFFREDNPLEDISLEEKNIQAMKGTVTPKNILDK